jgi:hypothetical protein
MKKYGFFSFLPKIVIIVLLLANGSLKAQSWNLDSRLNGTSSLIWWNNSLWTHNDHTDNKIYRLDAIGAITDSVILPINSFVDAEEISQDEDYIYIGDFGNNALGNRTNLRILRIKKTSIFSDIQLDTIQFYYPQQEDFTPQNSNSTNYDCEAFIVTDDSIYLFSKQWLNNYTTLYCLPKTSGVYPAHRRDSLFVDGLISGATYLKERNEVFLCGYTTLLQPFAVRLYDFEGDNFLSGSYNQVMLDLPFHQIEAIANDGQMKFYFTNEKFENILVNVPAKLHYVDMAERFANEISPISTDNPLVLYPNPVKKNIHILNAVGYISNVFVVYNEIGQKVYEGTIYSSQIELPINKLNDGKYILKIITNQRKEISTTFILKK